MHGGFKGGGFRGGGFKGGGFRGGGFRRGGFRGGRGRFIRPGFRGGFFNQVPLLTAPYFFPPDFYGDYYFEPPVTQAPQRQVVVVKTAEHAVETPPAPPVEPLVLELRGNHWVRITDSGESEVVLSAAKPGTVQAGGRRPAKPESATPVHTVPPAVLVFRDGHEEQINKYAIIGPLIYTSTSYWVAGSWTRKIPIAELNIPATLRLNRERGANFSLPSAPNEVVVRP